MTTVAQLITYLQTLPQEGIVEVLQEETKGWDTITSMKDLDIDAISILDFTSKEHYEEKYPHLYGKVFVQLGA